ncbi:hypothetical protein [Nocardia miyunensis]|uniref:hypothetical protein n=1 Tax=Nocardia miyunensis TaxID=282684 RepID=UPI0012F4F879|nr:hypothetical protein [Nocardia miyunensis]
MTRVPAGSGRSLSLSVDDRKRPKPAAGPSQEKPYDPTWVRSCLHQCDLLATARSIDADGKTLIRFAIQWAPFGGAGAEELLVTFGITRRQFVQSLRDKLLPRIDDSRTVRTIKRNLTEALSPGWRMQPSTSAVPGPTSAPIASARANSSSAASYPHAAVS